MSMKAKTVRKVTILTAAYALVGMVLSFAVLSGTNKAYGMHANPGADVTGIAVPGASSIATSTEVPRAAASSPAGKALSAQTLPVSIAAGADGMSFTDDGKYMVYLLKGKLFVANLADGSSQALPEKAPVDRFQLMADRNIILFFTHRGSTLYVKTYGIDNAVMTQQKTIHIAPGSSVKGSDYSYNTNMIAITVAPSGGIGNSTIYQLNVMKRLQENTSTAAVDSLVLLNKKTGYYSADDKGNLYYNLKPVQALSGTAVRLLGCDQNDTVYAQSVSDSRTVYRIQDLGIAGSIRIDDPNFTAVYSTKTAIYLVYPDRIVNISAEKSAATPYKQGLKFLAVSGSTAYFEDRAGAVVSLPLR